MQVSRDGKTAAMLDGGKLRLQPIDGGNPQAVGPVAPGDVVTRWTADGRAVYMKHSQSATEVSVYTLDVRTGETKSWRVLRPADPVGVTMGPVSITPDGYAYSFQRDLDDLYLAYGLK